jgi:hypothetical protein
VSERSELHHQYHQAIANRLVSERSFSFITITTNPSPTNQSLHHHITTSSHHHIIVRGRGRAAWSLSPDVLPV